MSGQAAPTILVTCELEAGLDHLMPLVPLVRRFRAAGHQVFLALRHLSQAKRLFGDLGVSLLQAPNRPRKPDNAISAPRTFVQILQNCGFSNHDELATLAQAWAQLFDFVRPELVLFEHSPVALVAARRIPAKRVTIGTGFCCPPDIGPFPDLRRWEPHATHALIRDEQHVLDNTNRVLETWKLPSLERFSQLYGDVDECLLATFRELDAYPDRQDTRYWGVWSNPGGDPPIWPPGEDKRIYAYLKNFQKLPDLLRFLQQLRASTLVYVDRLDVKTEQQYRSESLRFVSRPLDLGLVGRQCHLAILNGGLGSTATLLLAGCPVLQLPRHLEQAVNSIAATRMRAGLSASPHDSQDIVGKLTSMLRSDRFARGASRFARRYRDFDPQLQIDRIVNRIHQLLHEARGLDPVVGERSVGASHVAGDTATGFWRRAAPATYSDDTRPRIIVGMGAGRCGTTSLAWLLSLQPSTVASHESRPLLPWDTARSPQDVRTRFRALADRYPLVARVGDVASFYLPYVDEILAAFSDTRVICLRRDREETVESFLQWLSRTRNTERVNHWSAERDGLTTDEYDICFPKYSSIDLPTALRRYWDDYYTRAADLARQEPERFRIFDVSATLNDPRHLSELLSWLEIPPDQQELKMVRANSREEWERAFGHPRKGEI